MKKRSSIILVAALIVSMCSQGGSNYVITDKSQPIPVLTGDDTLTINLSTLGAQQFVWLDGDNSSWSGVLDIQRGIVAVSNSAALGSAVIYNTNETFAANANYNARLDFYKSVTAANEIHIGSETPLNRGPRLVSRGTTTLSGPLYYLKGCVGVSDGGTLTLAGDVICTVASFSAGSYFVMRDGASYYDVRFIVTGRFTNLDTLYPEGTSTGVKFMTAGQSIAWPIATHGGSIVCGLDNVFQSANIIGRSMQNIAMSYFDLNGTSQSFKNNNEQTHDSGVRIRNSNEHAKGTITVTQTKENAASNLMAAGPLDFVKRGSEMLVLTNRFHISGTLDVAEGTLKFTGPQTTIASQVIVRAGAALDLGGRTYRCTELALDGGCVRNGTLLGTTNLLMYGTIGATLAGGVTVKTGAGDAMLDGGVRSGFSTLTNGLVACWHFDSAETLYDDAGPYGYTLANCWTNSMYKVAASNGSVTFDANTGRYGSGSAYFSEHVFLSYPGGYPAKAPRGREPLTLAFWFRLRDGYKNNRGLCFLGGASTGHGLGMVMWNNTANIMNYLWGGINEVFVSPTDGANDFCDAWHSVVQVWDGGLFHVYIDGKESAQTPRTATVTRTKGTTLDLTPTCFYIGTGYNNMYLGGWMDEVALWNRALTPAEIAEYIADGVPTGKETKPTPAKLQVDAGTVKLSDASLAAGLTNGIVLNYRFDTPATLYQDSGPYGYTLTEGTKNTRYRTGGTKVTCATAEGEWAHGGGAAYFDGTNNLVLANGVNDGVAQPAMIPTGANPFTLGFFFRRAVKYPANVNDAKDYENQGLIFYGNNSQVMGVNGYAFWSWQTQIWNYPGGQKYEYLLPPSADSVNRAFRTGWHSVVQTWNGSVMRYWVDGMEIMSPQLKNPTDSPRTPNTAPDIGNKWFYISGAYNNPFFKGWMDDVTIWNRALSEREVMAFVNYGLDFAQGAATVCTSSGNMTMNAGTSAVVRTVGGVDTVLRTDGMTIIILR